MNDKPFGNPESVPESEGAKEQEAEVTIQPAEPEEAKEIPAEGPTEEEEIAEGQAPAGPDSAEEST